MASAWLVGLWLWLGHKGRLLGWQTSLADIFRIGAVMAFALAVYGLTLPHTKAQGHGHGWLAPAQALRLLRRRDFAVYLTGSLLFYVTFACTMQMTR